MSETGSVIEKRISERAQAICDSLQKEALKVEGPRHPLLRPYSATLGRLPGTVSYGLVTGRPGMAWRKWTPERIEMIKRLVQAIEEKYGLEENPGTVYLGGAKPLKQLARVWSRKDLSLPGRLVGTAVTPLSSLLGTLTRSPYYDPYSNTAVLFDPEHSIAAHELGHMVDWAGRGQKTLYHLLRGSAAIPGLPAIELPVVKPVQEHTATGIAESVLDEELTDKERERAMDILRRAFGTYIGRDVQKLFGLGISLPPFVPQPLPIIGAHAMGASKVPSFELGGKALTRIQKRVAGRERVRQETGWLSHLLGLSAWRKPPKDKKSEKKSAVDRRMGSKMDQVIEGMKIR